MLLTNLKYIYIKRKLLILALVFWLSSCNKNSETINNYPISDFIEECKGNDFHDLKPCENKLSTFQIGIPKMWLVDNDSGLAAVDTLSYSKEHEINSLAVSSHPFRSSIDDYFQSELNGLEQDFKILEIGKWKINTLPSRWVITEENYQEKKIINLISYVPNSNNNTIYIINLSIDKSKDYKDRLCNLKSIISSFEVLN